MDNCITCLTPRHTSDIFIDVDPRWVAGDVSTLTSAYTGLMYLVLQQQHLVLTLWLRLQYAASVSVSAIWICGLYLLVPRLK